MALCFFNGEIAKNREIIFMQFADFAQTIKKISENYCKNCRDVV